MRAFHFFQEQNSNAEFYSGLDSPLILFFRTMLGL